MNNINEIFKSTMISFGQNVFYSINNTFRLGKNLHSNVVKIPENCLGYLKNLNYLLTQFQNLLS